MATTTLVRLAAGPSQRQVGSSGSKRLSCADPKRRWKGRSEGREGGGSMRPVGLPRSPSHLRPSLLLEKSSRSYAEDLKGVKGSGARPHCIPPASAPSPSRRDPARPRLTRRSSADAPAFLSTCVPPSSSPPPQRLADSSSPPCRYISSSISLKHVSSDDDSHEVAVARVLGGAGSAGQTSTRGLLRPTQLVRPSQGRRRCATSSSALATSH